MQPVIGFRAFQRNLKEWLDNSYEVQSFGLRNEVQKKIEDVFKQSSDGLDLENKHLNTLPRVVVHLKKLESLILRNNQFTSIPDGIGSLTELRQLDLGVNELRTVPKTMPQLLDALWLDHNLIAQIPKQILSMKLLTTLDLSNNLLTALPDEISQLGSLKKLILDFNCLGTLPKKIGDLSNLNELSLENNRLKTLPWEIGYLSELETLDLSCNRLTSLPASMGMLQSLKKLMVNDNSDLEDLPESLGCLEHLEEITVTDSGVAEAIVDSIFDSITDADLQCVFWLCIACAGGTTEIKNYDFILDFDNDKQCAIYEWVMKLIQTLDFRVNQQAYAQAMCGMLLSLEDCEPFKEFFFDQIVLNNADCHDRATMGFNELYVAWKILTLKKTAPIKESMKLLIGGAKTIALRNTLGGMISQYELEKAANIWESVEVFLYYEIDLRETLGLLTISSNMAHHDIGKLQWINEAGLCEIVLATYMQVLVEMPITEIVARRDPQFVRKCKVKLQTFETQQTELDDSEFENENDYIEQCNALRASRQGFLHKQLIAWVEDGLKRKNEEPVAPPSKKRRTRSERSYAADN